VLKASGFSAVVENTHKPVPELIVHQVKVLAGEIRSGQKVEAVVDSARRKAISRNHTSTHLLHAALRQILGDHVRQSGSLVDDKRLRFDFTHFAALSEEEIQRVEKLINEKIIDNLPVTIRVTSLEEGLAEGAMAIFEEKYGEKVRLVKVGEFSKELCGGIHVKNTGEIGLFKITAESSVAAGLRRIEAVTGEEALNYILTLEKNIKDLEKLLKVGRQEIMVRVEKLLASLEEKDEEIRKLKRRLLNPASQPPEIREMKGIKLVTQKVEDIDLEALRNYADQLKQKIGSGIVVLASVVEGRVWLVVGVTADLTQKIQANKIIKEIAPVIGGGGGGRTDFAQAEGNRPENIDQALRAGLKLIEELL